MAYLTVDDLPPPPPGKTGWPWTEGSASVPDALPKGGAWPKITVAASSYNQAQFIEEAIRSVLLQGYPNLEYIVVDDCSTDNSVAVIERYREHLTYWVNPSNRGAANVVNQGWAEASSGILGRLSSDDAYRPRTLEHVADTFHRNPECLVVSGAIDLIDIDSRTIMSRGPRSFDAANILGGRSAPWTIATFFERQVLEEVGGLSESLRHVADWDFSIRVARRYSSDKFVYLPGALAAVRRWERTGAAAEYHTDYDPYIAELNLVLDRTFSDPNLPKGLTRIKRRAYSKVKWRHAGFAGIAKEPWRARRFALESWLQDPSVRGFRDMLNLWVRLFVPAAVRRRVRQSKGTARNW